MKRAPLFGRPPSIHSTACNSLLNRGIKPISDTSDQTRCVDAAMRTSTVTVGQSMAAT